MDKLYIGDIPSDYHFASFGNNYIDLYNVSTLSPNRTYEYYRVYMYDNYFCYEKKTNSTGSYYNIVTFTSVDVTNNRLYRRDFSNVCIISFVMVFFFVFLFNIITSCIRKGGLLGGLL